MLSFKENSVFDISSYSIKLGVLMSLTFPFFLGLSPIRSYQASNSDSTEAIQTLNKFRDAILSGDRQSASDQLTDQAVIMQAGEQCDRESYVNKHIIPECKYVYSVRQSVDRRIVRHRDQLIWISTSYNVDVKHEEDDTVHRKLAELAVLKQVDGRWKIDMIHWSNCPRYPSRQ